VVLDLSFGQIEAALIRMNRIADDKRVAFRARLKHLQRLGFPPGTNTGTGKRASYRFSTYMQMVLAVELMQAGFTPARTVKIVEGSWYNLRVSVWLASMTDERRTRYSQPYSYYDVKTAWMLHPEALRDLSQDGEGRYDYMEAISAIPMDDVGSIFSADIGDDFLGAIWRTLVLDAFLVVRAARQCLLAEVSDLTPDMLTDDIEAEMVEDGKRLAYAMKDFPKDLGRNRDRD